MATNSTPRFAVALDHWQRRHAVPAFLYAVVRKYVDDEAGLRAALLAYYGFLSLFPLLLVLTTVFNIVLHNDSHLSDQIIRSALNYLPAVGRDLQQNVHTLDKTGIALAAGVLLTLYGARGVADVLRSTLDHVWQVPYAVRSRLPFSLFRSFAIIVVGGSGLTITPVVLSYTFASAHSPLVKACSTLVTALVLFWVLVFVIKVGTSQRRPLRSIWVGSLFAVVTLSVLQSLGGLIMAHELQQLDTLYGTFALVLGLIFWLYLQTQVLVYALEIDSVRVLKLWPRSIEQRPITDADHKAYHLYATRAQFHDDTL